MTELRSGLSSPGRIVDELTITQVKVLVVGHYRALLTDREREILRGDGDVSKNYHNQVRHRVRVKISQLEEDIDLLRTHQPDLAQELDDVLADALDDSTVP